MKFSRLLVAGATLCIATSAVARTTGNEFNPAVSLILNGLYTDFDEDEFALPGFQVGGEAGLPEKGFSLDHTELTISASIDQVLYGEFTAALEAGEVEIEEAYVETLGLGGGLTLRGGRFFSGFGYINDIHVHAQDFVQAPLTHQAMFGTHLFDDGVQARWIAPTETYVELGAELLSGRSFPGGDNEDGNEGVVLFGRIGGDLGDSWSWRTGASGYASEFDVREAGGHHHGDDGGGADNELLDGEVDVLGLDAVFKWAPGGNPTQRNLALSAEYLLRNEEGEAEFAEDGNVATARYDGEQTAWYVSAVYQWQPRWRVGLRHERLSADNDLDDFTVEAGALDFDEFADESGLGDGDDPERTSLMVDYSPSEFSRFRVQLDHDDLGHDGSEERLFLQYTTSLGAHGAHGF
jgi:hypothetical protein